MRYPTYYSHNPYHLQNTSRREPLINSVFDRFFGDIDAATKANLNHQTLAPQVDILESDSHYQLVTDLPGFKKEELNIAISDGVLTLKAEKQAEEKSETEENGIKVLRSERSKNTYQRKFSIEDNIDTENVNANLEDGVLTVTLPKLAETKPTTRQIPVG